MGKKYIIIYFRVILIPCYINLLKSLLLLRILTIPKEFLSYNNMTDILDCTQTKLTGESG